MTEYQLETATKVKKKLDMAREYLRDVEEKMHLSSGNYSEVAARRFKLVITEGEETKEIKIMSQSAYKALVYEHENADGLVKQFKEELENI